MCPSPPGPYAPVDATLNLFAGDTSTIDLGIPDDLLVDGKSLEVVRGPASGDILFVDIEKGRLLYRPGSESQTSLKYRVRLGEQWKEAELALKLVAPAYEGEWQLRSVGYAGGQSCFRPSDNPLVISMQADGTFAVPAVSVSCSFNAVWKTVSVSPTSSSLELQPDASIRYSSSTSVTDIRGVSSSPTTYSKSIWPSGVPGEYRYGETSSQTIEPSELFPTGGIKTLSLVGVLKRKDAKLTDQLGWYVDKFTTKSALAVGTLGGTPLLGSQRILNNGSAVARILKIEASAGISIKDDCAGVVDSNTGTCFLSYKIAPSAPSPGSVVVTFEDDAGIRQTSLGIVWTSP